MRHAQTGKWIFAQITAGILCGWICTNLLIDWGMIRADLMMKRIRIIRSFLFVKNRMSGIFLCLLFLAAVLYAVRGCLAEYGAMRRKYRVPLWLTGALYAALAVIRVRSIL